MSKNQPPADKIPNKLRLASLINASRPGIFKMTKDGKEFYFDSTDLPEHEQEFEDMEKNGWVLVEQVETLPAYLPARLRALEDAGLAPSGWGYKRSLKLRQDSKE